MREIKFNWVTYNVIVMVKTIEMFFKELPKYGIRYFCQKLGYLPKADIWIHAASMGELMLAKGYVEKMFPRRMPLHYAKVLITTNEIHDVQIDNATIVCTPYEDIVSVRRSVKRVSPGKLIIYERDYRPNLIREMYRNNIPISVKSGNKLEDFIYYGYKFQYIHCICWMIKKFSTKSEKEVKLKPDGINWSKKFGLKRKAVVVGSVHREEFNFIKEIRKEVEYDFIIVPRYIEDVPELLEMFKDEGTIIVETLGDLPQIYRIADIAIVGGSFVDGLQGHNILEPFGWGVPVIFGDYMDACKEAVDIVLSSGGGLQSQDISEIIEYLRRFLCGNKT